MTRERVLAQLEKAIAKDAEDVFNANKQLWLNLGVSDETHLKELANEQQISTSSQFTIFRQIIKLTQ